MDSLNSETVKRVKQAAKVIGSYNKLSVKLGVSRRSVSRWVNGHSEPIPAFKVSIDKIIGNR